MGQTTLLAKLVSDDKNCEWIYRICANPGMLRGSVLPPFPALAPGSVLRSHPLAPQSSSQARSVYPGSHPGCKSSLRRSRFLALLSFASGLGLCQPSFPLGPDRITATRRDGSKRLPLGSPYYRLRLSVVASVSSSSIWKSLRWRREARSVPC